MPTVRSDHFLGSLKPLLVLLVAGLSMPVLAQSIDEELPLPKWENEAPALSPGAEPGSQFNSLLPADTLLPAVDEPFGMINSGPRLADAPPTLMPGYGELGPTDLSLFLHGGILQSAKPATVLHQPTPAMSLRDLPQDVLAGLDTAPANEYLVDPQGLVTEVARLDLERLLEFHAKEARIRLYVLVLGTDQKLPAEANLDTLAHGALTRQHACLAVYPLGEPWRARFLMSKGVHQSATVETLSALAADCIQDAQQADESAQQLQRFAVRLSTRLFWLEKGLRTTPPQTPGMSLQEVVGAADAATAISVGQTVQFWRFLTLSVSGITLLFVLLMLHRFQPWRRRTPDHSRVWMLPDPDVLPRLGGAFSGGTSAVLSFKR